MKKIIYKNGFKILDNYGTEMAIVTDKYIKFPQRVGESSVFQRIYRGEPLNIKVVGIYKNFMIVNVDNCTERNIKLFYC